MPLDSFRVQSEDPSIYSVDGTTIPIFPNTNTYKCCLQQLVLPVY